MAKQSGLGSRFLVGGYDLSGDVNAVGTIGGALAPIDTTDITQSAHSRIPGLADGSMSWTSFFDVANAHPVLSALPGTDALVSFLPSPLAVGTPVANVDAIQVSYNPTRSNAGDLTIACEAQADTGAPLEWCVALTPGVRADTGATNGASLDQGAGFTAPAVPATTVTAANTSPLTSTVVITGGTVTNVAVNGVTAGTGDGTYTVPSGGAIAVTYSAAPTWTWTLGTASGAALYLQATRFTGSSATVTVQHSADNSTWATLGAFTAVTAAPAFQRLAVTGSVSRYLRVISAGTFTALSFAAAALRYPDPVA